MVATKNENFVSKFSNIMVFACNRTIGAKADETEYRT